MTCIKNEKLRMETFFFIPGILQTCFLLYYIPLRLTANVLLALVTHPRVERPKTWCVCQYVHSKENGKSTPVARMSLHVIYQTVELPVLSF